MKNNESSQIHGMSPGSYVGLMNLIFLFPYIGWIISIVLWVIGKDQSEYVNERGKNLLNWMISCFIYGIVLSIVFIIGIIASVDLGSIMMFLILAVFGLFILICPIIAGIKALNNEVWNYPLALPILK